MNIRRDKKQQNLDDKKVLKINNNYNASSKKFARL